MNDDTVVLLKKEQVDDDSKREYCNNQFDSLEDSMKGLERSISDSEVAIEDAKETIIRVLAKSRPWRLESWPWTSR